jgi:chitodextrinase
MAVIKIVPMPGAVGDKGDPGETGAQGPQGQTGQTGQNGQDALWSYQGAWQSNAAYAVGDLVTYEGQLYYAKAITTTGTLPTDTSKFDLLAAKGADGEPGLNGLEGEQGPQGEPGADGTNGADALWNYTGEYNGGASYAVGDLATYDGQLWYRVGANGGNVGDIPSPGFWNLLAAKGEDAPVGTGANGEVVRYSPLFQAIGLEFTAQGIENPSYPTYNSYYVKNGKVVSFGIELDFSTVTNFGTGQYMLELPFPPAFGFNHFSGWAQIDAAVNPDVANGHVILNVDHAGLTTILDLHYLKQAGGANSPIIEGLFKQNTPVTLTTSSKVYVNGTYISA